MTKRGINFAGALACVLMMAYALYSQYVGGLEPCPLCIFQRVAVIALGIVFLIAALHNPARMGGRVYGGLVFLAAAAGAAVAGRHVYLQNLPPDQVPACGPGLGYMLEAFPMAQALKMVFSGSGECANIDWSFLGLSMPAWVLICVVVLGLGGIWNNARA